MLGSIPCPFLAAHQQAPFYTIPVRMQLLISLLFLVEGRVFGLSLALFSLTSNSKSLLNLTARIQIAVTTQTLDLDDFIFSCISAELCEFLFDKDIQEC